MFFLENKGLICGKRDTGDRGDKEQNSGEEERLGDLWAPGWLAAFKGNERLN